jgi:iron complex outermembrane receptor protein
MKNLYDASSSFSGSHPQFATVQTGEDVYYDFDNPIVKPEKMLDIELGYSYRNENLYFSVNGYFMDYSDELVKTGKLDIFGNPVDGNAPKTRHTGLELQASYLIKGVIPGSIKPFANATFSKNEILEWDYISTDQKAVSLEGNDIAGFPSLMANFGFIYEHSNLYINLAGRYLGESKTDNYGDMLTSNEIIMTDLKNSSEYYTDNTLDAFLVFNLDLAYTFRDVLGAEIIKVHTQVINLFNKLYAAGAEGRFFFFQYIFKFI